MKQQIADELTGAAHDAAVHFSSKDREKNFNNEDFEVHEIVPLSEYTAAVVFLKNTGKKAVAFFYYVKNSWRYFFPTDSHFLGMRYVERVKSEIERENFKVNMNGG